MSRGPRRFRTLICTVVFASIAGAAARLDAQSAKTFTLDQVIDFPFPAGLVASPTGSAIAWTLAERGVRNIYVAEGPDFKARRLTPYTEDDGQELTSLSFSPDGGAIVYVRGGDHGSNWPAEGNLPPNPSSGPSQPKVQIWAAARSGDSAPKLLGEGDEPVISPSGDRVAFEKDRRIWVVPIDGSKPAEAAFFARGSSETPRWAPDGRSMAFVSDRDDHSFIAIFTDGAHPLRYLSPTTSRDRDPVWSLDGKTIAFVRLPGRGGTPQSPLKQTPQPWSIWIAPADGSAPAQELWKSGTALVDSISRTVDGLTLRWAASDRIVFPSYQDGWPHLFSIEAAFGPRAEAKILTPGALMVEHVALSPDRKTLVYSANTGADRLDIDRRHLFTVPVDGSKAPVPLTSGEGLEWAPVVTGDGRSVAFLGSGARKPPLPAVILMAGGQPKTLAEGRIPAAFPAPAQLVTPEQVIFKASDGLEVHGQLFRSASADNSKKPALVYVHGGPPRQMLLGWHYMDYYANDYAANQYLASRGFIVLSVNYRLGIGYGHAFHFPEKSGARGAAEYLDVLAGAKYLQSRTDVDPKRLGIWGGSYGGFLTALALGRNSDIFAAGVDIHGVHNWERQGRQGPDTKAALAGDGITEADIKEAARVTFDSSPVSSVKTWRSPVLLIHADDDRNVEFHQTVDLKQRLIEKGVDVEELVIPDDIHDFLLFRSWKAVTTAAGEYFERRLMKP